MLKGVGLGALALVVVGSGAVGIRAATNGVFDSGEGTPYDLWTQWQSERGVGGIVAAGVLAANPHNIQPWTFVVGTDSIDLYADPTRAMPIMDSDGRERMVGFGCAIENMAIAARARGLVAEVTPLPDANAGHIAHLALQPGVVPSTQDRALAEAIGLRHSNRGPYASRSVSETALSTLTSDSPGLGEPTPDVVWITDTDRRRALGEM
ncbi:hypothetical protein ACWDPV_17180 [Gordonia sp. NPDC003504]